MGFDKILDLTAASWSVFLFYNIPVTPVGYQVLLEPGLDRSVSRVRITPSAHSYEFVGTFLVRKLTCGKHERERELATLVKEWTSSGIAESYLCATKIESKNRGGRRDDTCDHGL